MSAVFVIGTKYSHGEDELVDMKPQAVGWILKMVALHLEDSALAAVLLRQDDFYWFSLSIFNQAEVRLIVSAIRENLLKEARAQFLPDFPDSVELIQEFVDAVNRWAERQDWIYQP
ncbi:hypothetical protein [Amycolatopsis palatopharyngis]|uniref:hypothetical protein n=1 Tax=Amycolatopsis palatopharyngis TaxID=187982 RepID=UPI0013BEA1C1|nr:hypothetical protein [Amycolatopsis palatopharyngis]